LFVKNLIGANRQSQAGRRGLQPSQKDRANAASAAEVTGHVIEIRSFDLHVFMVLQAALFWVLRDVLLMLDVILNIANPVLVKSLLPNFYP
jgi:hypothetical protein